MPGTGFQNTLLPSHYTINKQASMCNMSDKGKVRAQLRSDTRAQIFSCNWQMCTRTLFGSLLSLVFLFVEAVHASTAPLSQRCWQTSFNEDFDSLDLWDSATDSGRWKTSYIWGSDIIINNELQYYVDPRTQSINPFSIDAGVLSITASKTPARLLPEVKNRHFLSGVLTTEKGFSQQYGRFEVRARVPEGKGLWSAFWLLPSFTHWPEGVAVLPEIDVMEHLGDEVHTFHTTLHTNQSGELKSYPSDHTVKDDLTSDFHLYSVVWRAEQVHWYLDKRWVASHPTPADFTRPVHLLLNLAVGGNWPGNPDRQTHFPAQYQVDYVRVYTELTDCK